MLTRQGESQETLSENGKLLSKKTFLLELEPAGTGTGTIGPFSIQYLDPATQASGSLDVQAYNVSLLSPPKNKTWIFAAAGLLAAALIGILSTFLKKRRKAVPETAAVVSPADQAIARIREIAAVGGTWKQEDKLSGISSEFRSFLMSHYGIQKARAADPEILSELELRKLDSLEIKTVRDLCGRIHEAKYSGAPLSDRDLKDFSEDIVHFISGKRIVGNP
ncbi:MAG TPA: hypothetical protein VL688_10600 [Verrucomicrobiae bacterium]|nr:hypothetical protein [Verrucomicrobiae bacterium]